MRGAGPLRALAAVGGCAALVWGSTQVSGAWDVTRSFDEPNPAGAQAGEARAQLLCPGSDSGSAATVASSLVSGSGTIQATSLPGAALAGLIPTTTRVGSAELPRDRAVAITASGAAAAGLRAVQTQVAGSASTQGLSTLTCAPAQTSFTLLGGGPGSGRLERVVLANPGATAVRASVSTPGAATQEVLVPARGRAEQVLPATRTGGVVRVNVESGAVSGMLAESEFLGSVSHGTETTGPSRAGTDLIVPAVVIGDGGRGVVRVAAPTGSDAVVRVSVLNASGDGVDDLVETVKAGDVRDLRLPETVSGTVALRVRADVPVWAAGESLTAQDVRTIGDRMWVPAVASSSEPLGSPVPQSIPGQRSVLVLANPSEVDQNVTVRITGADGGIESRRVRIPTQGSTGVAVTGAHAVAVEPSASPVAGALVLTGRRGDQPLLSGVALTASSAVQPPTPSLSD